MNQEILEWLLLLGRWLHIVVGITWIGTSIFFMWLDRSIEPNPESKRPGHLGELWMVHGGGFYHVEKLQMGPTPVPEVLHWFKWESYWTWLSGIFLLTLLFYTGGGTYLLDSSVSSISLRQAIAISVGSILVSWFFYDFLWESNLTKKSPALGHALTLAWFGGMTYFLCHTLSGRAAYIHMGAMIGTWMTANVFLRIIPRQVKMVEAAKRGESVNPEWSKNAKNRSTHNTYLTLPVIFIMLSNHFPSTYGSKWNWLILLLISAAGAAIREFFVARLRAPQRSKIFGAIGALLILIVMTAFREDMGSNTSDATPSVTTSTPAPSTVSEDLPGLKIRGVVSLSSKTLQSVPAPEKMNLPLPCMQDKKEITNNDLLIHDGKVQNVLVYIENPPQAAPPRPMPSVPVILDQKYCLYEPRIIGVRVGQKVDIVNSDPIFHNVKSTSKKNAEFNLAMPGKNDRITRVFDQPEISVQTKCSVHPWMTGYVAVFDHPYYAITQPNGEFSLSPLTPGKYKITFWHERLGTQTREVELKDTPTAEPPHLAVEF